MQVSKLNVSAERKCMEFNVCRLLTLKYKPMKNLFKKSALLVPLILFYTCTEEPLPESIPAVVTVGFYSVSDTTAVAGGKVIDEGGTPVFSRGVCWSTEQDPVIGECKTMDGKGAGSFTSAISGLTANTVYYVRAYATNNTGTGYGDTYSFVTRSVTVADIDGNVYNTVTIGEQVWMVENLKTTHYRNGEPVAHVTASEDWFAISTGAYRNYNDDARTVDDYGRLYNWYAVNDPRNICPEGWHVPSREEWTILAQYLGGNQDGYEYIAGGKLKETGSGHWLGPNAGATNESGFTALPGGCYGFPGPNKFGNEIMNIRAFGHWWSSSEYFTGNAFFVTLSYAETNISRARADVHIGMSVRCIRDN
jgi:uncharacterized protein (TIGR02145 family)